MSAVTMDSICGRSGVGNGDTYSRCNFLQPGASGGGTSQYILLEEGSQGYKMDLNNFAPSASVAWRPDVESGFLRTLLGDPSQATLRAGYSEAYERQGLTRFTDLYGGNRGASISLSRDANTGLVPAGQTWPVLLSQKDRLYSPTFNPDPSYPIAIRSNRADSLNAFAPDIEIARVRNWMVGFARSIGKDMAVEIRYVGNRGDNEWGSINYNCAASNASGCTSIRGENLVANGFMNEFQLAMRNLQANNASGVASRVGSFAYFGSGTGTSPLPIYLAYMNGSARRRQSRRLYQRRQHLGECHHRRPARRTESQPERGGGRSRRQPHAPDSGTGPGIRVELLHRQPGRRQRQRHRQRRVQQVQRAAARAAAAAVEGLLRQPQLPVRVRGRVAIRRLQLRPRLDRGAGDRQPDRPSRHQVPGGLDAAVRPR